MLNFLPSPVLFVISFLLILLNSAFNGLLVFVLSLFKLLLPFSFSQRLFGVLANGGMRWWLEGNRFIMRLINRIEWQVEMSTPPLNQKGWHLVICNHQSWCDIVILGDLLGRRLPPPKFFLKQQLLYVPFIGLACWGLDMPFMRRYSRDVLLKKPHLRGKDITSTKRSCEKFRHIPTTVINFVEGTRFNASKRQQNRSPFKHLLMPKSGGLATALDAMGDYFNLLLDITLLYPDNRQHPFLDLMMGKIKRIVIKVESYPIDQLRGDPELTGAQQKRATQQWLQQCWERKDQWLEAQLSPSRTPTDDADCKK